MERHNFSTSIAFIPWNWRRSNEETVRLFKEQPSRLSFCVHGCDHTAGEWGTDDVHAVQSMLGSAAERMAAHDGRTGLKHDRIMVFPQGVFSDTAMRELKRANFIAVVNTEVLSTDVDAVKLKIADVWDIAVRTYAEFPLYTRRYPRQGVENLAFDILLGKPCLIVIHHDFCRDECRQLVEFIDRVNGLKVRLKWGSLREVVCRSFREREMSPGVSEIEMYAAEMLLENSSSVPKVFRVRRREADPANVAEMTTGADVLSWSADRGYVRFEVTLAPGESTLISVRHVEAVPPPRYGRAASAVKIGLRRYLSEFRDNYVVTAKARFADCVSSSLVACSLARQGGPPWRSIRIQKRKLAPRHFSQTWSPRCHHWRMAIT
jgi:hypothetical protein